MHVFWSHLLPFIHPNLTLQSLLIHNFVRNVVRRTCRYGSYRASGQKKVSQWAVTRETLLNNLNRFETYVNTAETTGDEPNIIQLKARLDDAKTEFSRFRTIQESLEVLDSKENEAHQRVRAEYTEKFYDITSRA